MRYLSEHIQRFPKWAMKVTSLIHFSLHTYIPIHFSLRGGFYNIFFKVSDKDKKFGNH